MLFAKSRILRFVSKFFERIGKVSQVSFFSRNETKKAFSKTDAFCSEQMLNICSFNSFFILLKLDFDTTESLVNVDWENGFVEASAKNNENVTQVMLMVLVIDSSISLDFFLDFQRTSRSGKNYLQSQSCSKTTPSTIIATESMWLTSPSVQCTTIYVTCTISRSATASATDSRKKHRRQTKLMHHFLIIQGHFK